MQEWTKAEEHESPSAFDSNLIGALRDRPEAFQRRPVRALAQLLEGAVADLADALAGHPQHRPDLIQRALLALVQPVVEVEDLALALGEVLLEHPLQELAPRLALHLFLDLHRLAPREALAEAGAVTVAAVERRVERELAGGHPAQRADGVDRLAPDAGGLLLG